MIRDLVSQIGRAGPVSGVWSGFVLLAAHGLPALHSNVHRETSVADATAGAAGLLRVLRCPRDRPRAGGFHDYRREHQRAVTKALEQLCTREAEVQNGIGSGQPYVGPLLAYEGDVIRISCYAAPRYYVNVSRRILGLRDALTLDELRVLFWLLWRHRGSRKSGPIWDCAVGIEHFSTWFGVGGRRAKQRGIRALTTLQELRVIAISEVERGLVRFQLSEAYFS